MPTEKPRTSRGILHFPRNQQLGGLRLFKPSEALAPFVEQFWAVSWVDQPRVVRETVPAPSVNLVFEKGDSGIHGIYNRKFCRTIEGTGRVLGIKFRPGGFRTFFGRSVAELTGRVISPDTLFGGQFVDLESKMIAEPDSQQAFSLIDAALQDLQPEETPQLKLVSAAVELAKTEPLIVHAQQLADYFAISLRSLQRVCRDYVGVGPKWIIQRFRLIEAAERIRNDQSDFEFAKVAVDLGYSDQSHLIRDFKLFVGMTPARYRRSVTH
ncbi:MAG: helix-turn-helix domain-containing protein [Planctomycetota bacterium]